MYKESDDLDEYARRRVAQTIACHDTDALPKVEGAGEVFHQEGVPVQRMHNGLVVEEGCYYGPWMTQIIKGLRGHHEPQEELVFSIILDRLAERADPSATPSIVEVGSFWAYYSMWFLRHLPNGQAVCMEPDREYLEVGRRNFALNGLSGAFLRGVIGPEPGQSLEFQQESDGTSHQVRQYDVASLLRESDLHRLDLLMVDIQGAETTLLERARPLLEQGLITYVVVSTHHHSISGSALTHQHARDLLRQCGGTILAEHTVSESFSGDGLIAASFDPRDVGVSIQLSVARARESLFGELEYDLDRALRELSASETLRRQSELNHSAIADELRALKARVVEEARLRADAESLLEGVLHSRSWTVTRPLRSLGERLKARQAGKHA